jgi:hypothetical protein
LKADIWWPRVATAGIAAAVFVVPETALAHAFGQRYDLPLPLSLFIFGGATAVALSFVVIGVFLRHAPVPDTYPRYNLLRLRPVRALVHPVTLNVIRAASAAFFVIVVVSGLFGAQNPRTNLAVVAVWVIAWVGLAYVSALLGNLWSLINPWNTLFLFAEWIAAKVRPAAHLSLGVSYPAGLGEWPAVVIFFIFAWMEIVWEGASTPFDLAVALIVYSLITWAGMTVFGRRRWLEYGEAFTVVFGLFARFAITEVRADRNEWNLRPPGVGLYVGDGPGWPLLVFVLLTLSTVSFDGFVETQAWQDIGYWLFNHLRGTGPFAIPIIGVVGLLSAPVLFVAVFLTVVAVIALVTRSTGSFPRLAPLFVLSIVPIAIAYHLSHYLSLLMIEGQLIIPQLSDPLGYDWNLFGTRDYVVNIAAIGAREIWFLSVFAIVIGHIVAVYLAHAEAIHFYGDHRRALVSQIPMLALMVGYTMISLWIIAQPIIT